MDPIAAEPSIDIFFLGSTAPNNIKRAIDRLLKKPRTASLSAPDLMELLLFQYPMAYDWQSELYSFSESELSALRRLNWWHSLFRISAPDSSGYEVLYQDNGFRIIPLYWGNQVLLDAVKEAPSLHDFYLFLLENQQLQGFMLVSKAFHKAEYTSLQG